MVNLKLDILHEICQRLADRGIPLVLDEIDYKINISRTYVDIFILLENDAKIKYRSYASFAHMASDTFELSNPNCFNDILKKVSSDLWK